MPRKRDISYGFYTNEDLADCSDRARLMFPGLWMMADREGRLDDRPKKIKATLFPFQDYDTEALLCELAAKGFVVRYTVEDRNYIQVINFKRHQRVHPKEVASKIPPLDVQGDTQGTPRAHPDNTKEMPSRALSSLPSIPSLSSLPSSPNGDSPLKAPKWGYCQSFLKWWSTYPRKEGKQTANRAWVKAGKRLRDAESITSTQAAERMQLACEAFAQSPKAKGRYCPQPATWLNQGRYDDDPAQWQRVDSPEASNSPRERQGIDLDNLTLE